MARTTAPKRRKRTEDTTTLPKKESGTIKVFRSYTANGVVMSEDEGLEDMDVKTFQVEPAYVSVNHGRTVNVGNFESVRVDVRVSLPCYTEEVAEAIVAADNLSSNYLTDVVNDYVKEI